MLEFLSYNLKKEGYEIIKAGSGREGLKLARRQKPHLIIMDVMMPGMDGFAVCREIRQLPGMNDTIVVFLTARGEDYSQIEGFDAGADDYLTKPIKPRVLTSRVKALLRRHRTQMLPEQQLELPDLTIDREKYVVVRDGKEIILPRKEFELLYLLTSRPNKVFSREEIFANVWGSDVIVGDRTIDVHVRKIREKTGLENIRTVKGVGYKFET